MRYAIATGLFFVPSIARAAGENGLHGGSMAGAVLQMFASLAVVIGIIYLLYYASNRWFKGLTLGKNRANLIRVVETRHLAPKRSLMLVEIAGEYLLLGSDNGGMRLIKQLEAHDEFGICPRENNLHQTPEVFLRKFDGMLDNALSGLKNLMDRDSRDKPVILKEVGDRK